MRKILTALLLVAVILALCACGGANQPNGSDPSTGAADPTATTQAAGGRASKPCYCAAVEKIEEKV